MASKSGQPEPEKAEVIDELLDALDTALDRVRVLYEQYFLGIQKQPPAYLHTEVERRIRDLTQLQIRNTAQRYRFATLQQKFGSYNSYWRRTLRQIEHGTYARSLLKIGRQAARTGAAVPEEILAAMPRRMREQVVRDREAALALAGLRERQRSGGGAPALAADDADVDIADLGAEDLDPAAFAGEPTDARPSPFLAGGAHPIDESDADFDVDAFFASVIHDSPPPSIDPHEAASRGTPSPPPPVAPPARTGQPRPASRSGSSAGADPAGTQPPSPGTSAATARGSTSGPPSAAEPAQPPRTTGPMRAVIARVKTESVPTTEVAPPRRRTGEMRAATPRAKTDPGASAEVAQPRRRTSEVRAATPRAKTDPGASAEVAPPRRRTSEMRAATPRAKTDPEVSAEVAPPRRRTDQMRAVTPRPKTDPGASAAPAQSARVTGQTRTPGPPAVPPRRSPAASRAPSPAPARPEPPRSAAPAPSQATKPLRVAPGAAAAHIPAPVETLAGPFPRTPSPRSPGEPGTFPATSPAPGPGRTAAAPPLDRPAPSQSPAGGPRQALPPGISNADVNTLYAQYVRAKRLLGEEAEPGTYGKLLRTIAIQAPKIMQQYKSKGVDFSVVVKDNQVIIRAKPKP